MRKSGVDRLQRHAEPLGQILPLGNLERHAGEADLRLRPREALAHCRGRNQEGRSDRRRVQPQDRLQHQRRPDGLLDCRMGASEHQREAPIGDPVPRVGGLFQFGVDQLERFRRLIGSAPPARGVDEAPPRRLREPPFRVRGRALVRPDGKRGSEGVGERVFGSRHVARRRREIGDELAVTLARHAGRNRARVSVASRRWEGALWEQAGRGAQFCLRLRHFRSHGGIRRRRSSAAPVPASRRHVSGGEVGPLRCNLAVRLRHWHEPANQVNQRPENDQRRQCSHMRRQFAIVDQYPR